MSTLPAWRDGAPKGRPEGPMFFIIPKRTCFGYTFNEILTCVGNIDIHLWKY